MPNWCNTRIVFDVEKEEDIPLLVDFRDKLVGYYNDPLKQKEFESDPENASASFSWIGNTQNIWNFETKVNYLRGFIVDIGIIEYDNFYIDQQDAWSEHIAVWLEIINKFYNNNIKLYFIAESEDNVFETNDFDQKYFVDKYIIDVYNEMYNTFDLKKYDNLYDIQGGIFHNFQKSIDNFVLNVRGGDNISKGIVSPGHIWFDIDIAEYGIESDAELLSRLRQIKSYNSVSDIFNDDDVNSLIYQIDYITNEEACQLDIKDYSNLLI